MLDATDQETYNNQAHEDAIEQQADTNKSLNFRKKFLSSVFNRKVGDFVIGAGLSAGVSTGTKLGAAALIGMTGAPVIVTAVGVAVVGGLASGAVRHAWNWHRDHRGMENAPSFWSAESGKKAFKGMLMSSVFAGAGGTLFSTLNHFYGEEIGAFVSKSANWLGLPSPEAMMDKAREAISETRVFNAAVAAGQRLTSSIEVMQIPPAETVIEKTKGYFKNIWHGAKIFAGVEPALSNTPPSAMINAPSLSPVAVEPAVLAPIGPATISPPVPTAAITEMVAPSLPDLPPVIEPVPALLPQTPTAVAPESVIRPVPRPVTEEIIRPVPRPVLEQSPVASSVRSVTAEEVPSFKLSSEGTALSFDHAAGTSSFVIDPQDMAAQRAAMLSRGADAALGFSAPIVPDTKSLIDLTMTPDAAHIYMPTDDVLKDRLLEAIDGRAARASTKALMDVAFGTAETAQEAADKAQAMKDLAFRALNGQGGIPKNSELGLELMRSAAAADNMQAKVDLAYIAYHGLHGVQASPEQALAQMNVLGEHSKAARDFAAEWTHGPRGVAKAAVGGSGGSLECAWQVDKGGHLAGGVCRGAGVRHLNVGDTVLVPVLKI